MPTPEEIARIRGAAFGQNRVASLSPITNETTPPLGVREAPSAQKSAQTTEAPANAPAANKGNTQSVYLGLCEALNKWQKSLVEEGVYDEADEYEILFKPPAMGASTIVPKGSIDHKATPMVATNDPNSKVNPEKNKSDVAAKTIQVTAGMQIIQFLEQYIRNSSYISDQQTHIITNESSKPVPSGNSPTGQVAWFKINVQSSALKYDKKRNDFAYKITYMITPYAINEMQSEWFPRCNFRGLHKSYPYWFTGQNTAVLGFEQNFNYLWSLAITGNLPSRQDNVPDSKLMAQKSWQTQSEFSSHGSENNINEPAANAANFLYDVNDQAVITLRIVGDPAWLVQGEAGLGVSPSNFTFDAFYPDGTINIDASEATFNVVWNAPVDYNSASGSGGLYGGTGLMDTSDTAASGLSGGAKAFPQQNYTYKATTVRSTFNKGRFEQELNGQVYILAPDSSAMGGEGREEPLIEGFNARESQLAREGLQAASTPIAGGNGTWDGETPSTANRTGTSASGANPSQASAPQPATSGGPITAGFADTGLGAATGGLRLGRRATNTDAPQTMAPKDA